MDASAERGRLEFFGAVGAVTLLLLYVALGVWLREPTFNPLVQLGRVAAFLLLALLAYGGARWARMLLALWSAALALTRVAMAILPGSGSRVWAFLSLAFGAAATYAAFVLFTSKAIDRFLAERKLKVVGAPPAA